MKLASRVTRFGRIGYGRTAMDDNIETSPPEGRMTRKPYKKIIKWLGILALAMLTLWLMWEFLVLPMPPSVLSFSKESACTGALLVRNKSNGKKVFGIGRILLRSNMPFLYGFRQGDYWNYFQISVPNHQSDIKVKVAHYSFRTKKWKKWVKLIPITTGLHYVVIGPYKVRVDGACYLFWPYSS